MLTRFHATLLVFAFAVGACGLSAAEEENVWPFWVEKTSPTESTRSWQSIGPLFFRNVAADGESYAGFRPLFLQHSDAQNTYAESTFLYPIFSTRRDHDSTSWTVFNLINSSRPAQPQSPGAEPTAFDVWPFYFSRDTGNPETSYHALFPIAGTIKSRFGTDRINWAVFPLYLRTEKADVVRTSVLWPIFKYSEGHGHHGFAIWPLFGNEAKSGAYRRQFYLWPLIYKSESGLSNPQPSVKLGFLPFYTREHSASSVSENFIWPFFGYTTRKAPDAYHENRYLWPLLVQGRGEKNYVNRWAPFYTHSIRKGVDKKWFMWPLIREQEFTDDGLVQTKRQLFWFVYWSSEQRSATNPHLAAAYKTHLWPLLSAWDNGAGRRQAQFPSPLDVFFPNNDKIRQLYSPLFALYRFDQRSPEDVRYSLLWNAITWHRTPTAREFHLGPLFSTERTSVEKRIAIGNGLIGLRRATGSKTWKLFLFDFSSRQDTVNPSTDP